MAEGLAASYEEERQELRNELIHLQIEFWENGEHFKHAQIVGFFFLFWESSSNDFIRGFIDGLRDD